VVFIDRSEIDVDLVVEYLDVVVVVVVVDVQWGPNRVGFGLGRTGDGFKMMPPILLLRITLGMGSVSVAASSSFIVVRVGPWSARYSRDG
jgi:hypothetical protein